MEEEEKEEAAIVSTHVLLDEEVCSCRIRTRVLSSIMLSRVLMDLFKPEVCENARCALQLCDTLMELVDQEPVLCPTCLRKLTHSFSSQVSFETCPPSWPNLKNF